MTHFLVQCSLQDLSGLPRDRYINTFHLDVTGFTEADMVALNAAFQAFYDEPALQAHSISYYLARHACTTPGTFKVYDQANPIPRKPVYTGDLVLTPSTDGNIALPAEVACCISYKSVSIGGVVPSRLRGRIYMGPLNTHAVENEPATSKARPLLDMRTYFVAHYIALMSAVADIPGFTLKQYSSKSNTLHDISEVWCDDAWDTQRRRGAEPSSRQTAIFV
jgi:hypothetical protein